MGLKVRALQVDENARQGYGLDAAILRAAIEEDRAAGRAPFILSAYRPNQSPSNGHPADFCVP